MGTGRVIVNGAAALVLGSALAFGGLAAGGVAGPVQAAHASKASANNKAASAYSKKARQLERQASGSVNATLCDLTGDGVDEAFFTWLPKKRQGSTNKFAVWSYKGGKLKCLLRGEEYGFYKVAAYHKTKSMVVYESGHGGEAQIVYRLKKGKFRAVAEKARTMFPKGKWVYYVSGNAQVSKAKYQKLTRKLLKGGKVVKSLH